jgi:hypothetical protein
MKKFLVSVLFSLFVLGIYAVANAEMRYGPQVIEDASVVSPKTLEVSGIMSFANNQMEIGPPNGVTPPKGPGGETPPTPKATLDIFGLTGKVEFGLGKGIDVGVNVPYLSQTSSSSTAIPTASGMSDITVKTKISNGYVSLAASAILPTGEKALSMPDNGTDFALNFALTPAGPNFNRRYPAKFHMNVGQTFWNSSAVKDKSSTNYGMAVDWSWQGKGNVSLEYVASTVENAGGDTPSDFYWGFRIDVSKSAQIIGLMNIGLSKASTVGDSGFGFGIGLKWMI